MRIGVISDLHVDYNKLTYRQIFNKIVESVKVNKLEAFFICGDLTNNMEETRNWLESMREELKDINLCPLFYIAGNHDEYFGDITVEADSYINHKVVTINNIDFIGWNGWYDYSYVEDLIKFDPDEYLKHFKEQYWADAHYIHRGCTDKEYFEMEYRWLKNTLASLKSKNTNNKKVVLTHFVPSKLGVLFKGDYIWDTCNAFMGSYHTGDLLEEFGVDHVFFGHTHSHFNFSNENKLGTSTNYHGVPLGYNNIEWFDFDSRWEESLKVIDL